MVVEIEIQYAIHHAASEPPVQCKSSKSKVTAPVISERVGLQWLADLDLTLTYTPSWVGSANADDLTCPSNQT